jgi:4-hydroxymandelate oxidase
MTPLEELVNAFEFEAAAKARLDPATFAEISGGDRRAFERITFRPRMMVNTTKLDLSSQLFGSELFAPIIIGPVAGLKRFCPEGELAMVRGASSAKAPVVISNRASYSLVEIAEQAGTTLWCQVSPDGDPVNDAQAAVKAGYKAIFLTLGASQERGADWKMIDRLRQGVGMPLILKGIMNVAEAKRAAGDGIAGIVVSNYSMHAAVSMAAPVEVLPEIADAVGGRLKILVDGSFRRGSDVLKALALGANAALLGRPPVWALSGYGADGVQRMLELLQTELARDMAMCGKPDLRSIDRSLVKIHRRSGA